MSQSLTRPVKFLFRFMSRAYVPLSEAVWRLRLKKLGRGTKISRRSIIYRASQVEIGNNVRVNDFVHIWGDGGVYIGDSTLIAAHVVITSQSHDVNAYAKGLEYRQTKANQPVEIGRNVWIGSAAVILPGVNIADNSVIAAGAVVTRNVPTASLVAGVPAKVVRSLTGTR